MIELKLTNEQAELIKEMCECFLAMPDDLESFQTQMPDGFYEKILLKAELAKGIQDRLNQS